MPNKGTAKLTWASKPRTEPNPKDIEFQPVEVVYPGKAHPAGQLSFPRTAKGEVDTSRMNRLIWGDNLLITQALLAQGYEGKINLIYIDPPFWTGDDFTYQVRFDGSEGTREPSIIERLAYTDTWKGGIDSYLDFMYPRLQLMKRLLADTGSIYVHMDWHVGHYVKLIMDEIFGEHNFVNEIIWSYGNSATKPEKGFPNKHNILFIYSKSDDYIYHEQLTQPARSLEVKFNYVDEKGMRYYLINKKHPDGSIEKVRRYPPNPEGLAPVNSVWSIPFLQNNAKEKFGYPTQKPEALLERIIKASSNEGDLVADFFCGSGTTGAVAEQLGRHWIMADLSKGAIQITRNRLVNQEAKPFVVELRGRY